MRKIIIKNLGTFLSVSFILWSYSEGNAFRFCPCPIDTFPVCVCKELENVPGLVIMLTALNLFIITKKKIKN